MRRKDALKLTAGQRVGCRWPGQRQPIPLTVVAVPEDTPELLIKARDDDGQVSEYTYKLLVAHKEADFLTDRAGSIVGITPMNPAAREWLDVNCQAEPWQWQGATLNVDSRMAPTIIEGAQAAGFTVET